MGSFFHGSEQLFQNEWAGWREQSGAQPVKDRLSMAIEQQVRSGLKHPPDVEGQYGSPTAAVARQKMIAKVVAAGDAGPGRDDASAELTLRAQAEV